jgi:hypothetical protein
MFAVCAWMQIATTSNASNTPSLDKDRRFNRFQMPQVQIMGHRNRKTRLKTQKRKIFTQ